MIGKTFMSNPVRMNIRQNFSVMKAIILYVLLAMVFRIKTNAQNYPFQNPALSIEERVNSIVSVLTPAEKLQLLRQNEPAISRLGLLPFTYWTEGLHGVGWGQSGTLTATQFPQAFGLGETWDTELMQRVGTQVAIEMRALYNQGKCGLMLRAPVCDLARDPRWGRTEESYGEDPFLVGKLSVAMIKGLRGNDPKYYMIGSLLKHFVAYSNETNRNNSSSNIDQRNLHEYYAKSFEIACVEGGALGYMTAYNAVNGVHCIFNSKLRDITRKLWGWNGAVCSDNYDLITSSGYSSMTDKAAAAVKNGTIGSFDDPDLGNAPEDAYSKGLMTIDDINVPIRNTMRVRTLLGDLDPQTSNPFKSITGNPWTTDSAKTLAKLVTQKSIVLLKNANNILPLDKNTLRSIAVIGNIADSLVRDWYGGYPPYKITPRSGIVSKVGNGVTVNFAANNNNNAAVNAARNSDIAIIFTGNNPTCGAGWDVCASEYEGKEDIDRKKITLSPVQDSLIRQVFRANSKTILVLMCNFPYAITWANDSISGIIHMTHSSQETGSALADVLFGDYNPAGRLNVTWPRSLSDVPDLMDYNIRNGRTYMYAKSSPLYPFGYGLSYTTFSYKNLSTSTDNFCKGVLNVDVDITNTGTRAGEEVVQMYVKYPGASISQPQKKLCGFKRTSTIAAGETAHITLPLALKDIAYWDSTQSEWKVESGSVQILVGGSSADTALKVSKNITLCGGTVNVKDYNKENTRNISNHNSGFSAIPVIQTRNSILLSLSIKKGDLYDLCIYNVRGEKIKYFKGNAESDRQLRLPFDKTVMSAGLYLVRGLVNGRHLSGSYIAK